MLSTLETRQKSEDKRLSEQPRMYTHLSSLNRFPNTFQIYVWISAVEEINGGVKDLWDYWM